MQAAVLGSREIVRFASVGNACKQGRETAVAVFDSIVDSADDRLRGANQISAAARLRGSHAFVANDRPLGCFVGQDLARGGEPAESDLPSAGPPGIDDFVKEQQPPRFARQGAAAQLVHAHTRGSKRGRGALVKHFRGRLRIRMRHGDPQDAVRLAPDQVENLPVVLELVVVGAAEFLRGCRRGWNQGLRDWSERHHVSGRASLRRSNDPQG